LNTNSQDNCGVEATAYKLCPRAFTLIELVVAIAVIGILAALLLPALAKAKGTTRTIQCLGNMRQLQLAWTVYETDYRDYLVPDGVVVNGEDVAWVTEDMSKPEEATNLTDITNGLLFPYSASPKVYHCPASQGPSMVHGVSAEQMVRTVSMTPRLGNIGNAGSVVTAAYPDLIKIQDVHNPGPARATCFCDESTERVDDGFFFMRPPPEIEWANWPTRVHSLGATFSFVDGHEEKWTFKGQTNPDLNAVFVVSSNNPIQMTEFDRMEYSIYPFYPD
jgi:prepilin-type N-terminal cleavage/methylation domain-containing protein/prepilin-type processing-associated H-X9-DG protein